MKARVYVYRALYKDGSTLEFDDRTRKGARYQADDVEETRTRGRLVSLTKVRERRQNDGPAMLRNLFKL